MGTRFRCAGLLLILLLTLIPAVHAQDDPVIARVGDQTITASQFQGRARFVRWEYLNELEKIYELTAGNPMLAPDRVTFLVTSLQNTEQFGDDLLGQMEDELLLWQQGVELGLTPTEQEIADQKAQIFSLWTEVAVDEIATSEEAQTFITNWYAEAQAASGLTVEQIDAIFAAELMRQHLFDYMSANMPTEELAIHSRHIMCSYHPDNPADMTPPTSDQVLATEQCIQAAKTRIEAGESFEQVAADVSDDTASGAQGGNLGWVIVSRLPISYAAAAETADLNQMVGPITTEFGMHLIVVLERQTQALTEDDMAEAQQGYFQLWLQTLRSDTAIERSEGWLNFVPTDPGLETLAPEILTELDSVIHPESATE